MRRKYFLLVIFLRAAIGISIALGAGQEPFSMRGYYMTFMRMPTMGMPEWKQMIDRIEGDRGNTVILWLGGAFRSKRYPITWQYNREHQNIQSDFVRDLIDYAHTKKIKVLIALTPFAYDGVNQYGVEHPELKARQKNGEPAAFWGMHSWGYNLCPSRAQSQEFMLQYTREMLFDFYGNADGLLLESSDYAICYCADCGQRFFEKEFQFVNAISQELWRRKPAATIMVYPHYFSGRAVPGFSVTGSTMPLDARWTLFFTPHSAHIDRELLKKTRTAVYWTEGLTLGTPWKIRDGARTALANQLTGYLPSLEPFSYVPNSSRKDQPRLKPFHFEWLRDGQNPLDELLIQVNRVAYREFSQDPSLSELEFKKRLGQELLGPNFTSQKVDDLLTLQESYFFEADWFIPSPLVAPERLRQRAKQENWPAAKWQPYLSRIERLKALQERYRPSHAPVEREMFRIATVVLDRWEKSERNSRTESESSLQERWRNSTPPPARMQSRGQVRSADL